MTHGLAIGLPAALAAAACFDGAVVLQASEARLVPVAQSLRLSLLQTLVRRRRWVLGTAIAVLGWPLQLLALAVAPITVVQPALAMGTIVLLYGGARVLGERVGPREWLAAAAVIAGVALIAVGHPALETNVAITPALLVCIGGLGLIAASPLLRRSEVGLPWLVIGAGSAFALSAITSKLVASMLDSGAIASAAAFGAATAAAAGLGFLLDMSALQRFDATRAAPPMFVLETAIPVLLAPWLFGEHWGAPVGVGLVLVLGGGALLGASRAVAGLEDEVGRSGT